MSQHALDLVRSKGKLPARYGNFIGGNWIAPADGQYFTDYSPINGAGAGGLEALPSGRATRIF